MMNVSIHLVEVTLVNSWTYLGAELCCDQHSCSFTGNLPEEDQLYWPWHTSAPKLVRQAIA